MECNLVLSVHIADNVKHEVKIQVIICLLEDNQNKQFVLLSSFIQSTFAYMQVILLLTDHSDNEQTLFNVNCQTNLPENISFHYIQELLTCE